MNYFYSQNHQQLLSKLVNNAVFPTLIEYLHHHQEEDIILRELKKNFDQPKFEAFLDQLIDENLIKRENRRYKLNFPIFEEETYQKEIEEAAAQILQAISHLSQTEKQLVMGNECWQECFVSNSTYFYATLEDLIPVTRQVAGNENYRFVSLNYHNKLSYSLANYFYLQKKQLPVPSEFLKLVELIGDVNETYYFDQVEVIIERIQAQKYKNRRSSIFFDSLILSNTVKVVKTNDQLNYQLALPLVKTANSRRQLPKIAAGRTVEEHAYIARKVYDRLIKELNLADFSYIEKIN